MLDRFGAVKCPSARVQPRAVTTDMSAVNGDTSQTASKSAAVTGQVNRLTM